MTPEFLEQLIKLYPNNYELGNAVRSFWHMRKEKPNLSIVELENEFLHSFQNNP